MKLTKVFFEDVRELILSARATVARGVDLVQVHTNFEIGRRIVEQEQKGKDRAAYGKEVLKALSERLTQEFGDGFSKRNLELMRRFFLLYSIRQGQIAQSPTAQLPRPKKAQSATAQLSSPTKSPSASGILQSVTAKSSAEEKSQSLTDQFPIAQTLTGKLTDAPQGRQHPRPRVSTLPARQGGTATQTARVDFRVGGGRCVRKPL